jgi:hypothetical protein
VTWELRRSDAGYHKSSYAILSVSFLPFVRMATEIVPSQGALTGFPGLSLPEVIAAMHDRDRVPQLARCAIARAMLD